MGGLPLFVQPRTHLAVGLNAHCSRLLQLYQDDVALHGAQVLRGVLHRVHIHRLAGLDSISMLCPPGDVNLYFPPVTAQATRAGWECTSVLSPGLIRTSRTRTRAFSSKTL